MPGADADGMKQMREFFPFDFAQGQNDKQAARYAAAC